MERIACLVTLSLILLAVLLSPEGVISQDTTLLQEVSPDPESLLGRWQMVLRTLQGK